MQIPEFHCNLHQLITTTSSHPSQPTNTSRANDHLGRLGHRSSPFPRNSHCPSGRIVFDEVDTQLPLLLLPLRRRVARERGRRAGPENTREVTSGVQRLSSACMQCSLAVLQSCCAFVHLLVRCATNSSQPSASQCSAFDEAAEHCETEGPEAGGARDQGPGIRDQGRSRCQFHHVDRRQTCLAER